MKSLFWGNGIVERNYIVYLIRIISQLTTKSGKIDISDTIRSNLIVDCTISCRKKGVAKIRTDDFEIESIGIPQESWWCVGPELDSGCCINVCMAILELADKI